MAATQPTQYMDMGKKALSPSAIRDEPMINISRKTEDNKTCKPDPETPPSVVEEDRGDVLMRSFWAKGTDCIFDVRVTDLDSPAYRKQVPEKVLASQEKSKKRKYLEKCLQQRRHFTPFVVSTDGMLGREANTTLKRVALKLAAKWQKPYSQVCGFVKSRMSIAIVRATHQCLRGSRIPTAQISCRPLWEDGAGLSLYEY